MIYFEVWLYIDAKSMIVLQYLQFNMLWYIRVVTYG